MPQPRNFSGFRPLEAFSLAVAALDNAPSQPQPGAVLHPAQWPWCQPRLSLSSAETTLTAWQAVVFLEGRQEALNPL
jgi:hypothetical protein